MIKTLDQLAAKVRSQKHVYRVAVAWAHDINTLTALDRACAEGFVMPILLGDVSIITESCRSAGIDISAFRIIESTSETEACERSVSMVKSGQADIVMKGLVGTDKFLKAVMNKENGLMLPDAVLTYVGAIELPGYHKLLFITDPAVIPYPDIRQKIAMVQQAIAMATRFGIAKPKIALIGANEKMNPQTQTAVDYAVMCKMADRKQLSDCIMDGPLDIFLACDRKSPAVKSVNTPVAGDADILLFPSLESSNPFYKGLMLFAGGELAGIIRGTSKPVIVMSRSESEKSKYYCIALACLMV